MTRPIDLHAVLHSPTVRWGGALLEVGADGV